MLTLTKPDVGRGEFRMGVAPRLSVQLSFNTLPCRQGDVLSCRHDTRPNGKPHVSVESPQNLISAPSLMNRPWRICDGLSSAGPKFWFSFSTTFELSRL